MKKERVLLNHSRSYCFIGTLNDIENDIQSFWSWEKKDLLNFSPRKCLYMVIVDCQKKGGQ